VYSPDFKDRAQVHRQDFQKGGSWDHVQGVVQEGGSSENIPDFENIRMALVMTSPHKYIQLSSSNHALLIRSRTGMVMMLLFEL